MSSEMKPPVEPNAFDMSTTEGTRFDKAKQEMIITACAYGVWGLFVVIVAGLFGYTTDHHYVWGMPLWVVLGICIPWVACIVWQVIFAIGIFKE